MKRVLVALVLALVVFTPRVSAGRLFTSIAFDAAAAGQASAGASSLTYAHTVTGSNTILFESVSTGNNSPTVAYAGNAMTEIGSGPVQSGYYNHLFYQINPTTGTNNVVVTLGSGTNCIIGASASYTGALQSGVPDSSNTGTLNASGQALSISTTVVGSNAWLVMGVTNSPNTAIPGGGTGTRRANSQNACTIAGAIFDSNATVGTGSQSIATGATTGFMAGVIASFLPAGGGAASVLPGICCGPRGGGWPWKQR